MSGYRFVDKSDEARPWLAVIVERPGGGERFWAWLPIKSRFLCPNTGGVQVDQASSGVSLGVFVAIDWREGFWESCPELT